MSNNEGRTSTFFGIRADFAQLVIVAILLAFGVHILATGVADLLVHLKIGLISSGITIVVTGLLVAFWRVRPSINGTSSLVGAILLTKKREIIEVERYSFSGDLKRYVKGLTAENKALARIWGENDFFSFSEKLTEGRLEVSASSSRDLAIEAIEYFALDLLSTHLTDYFNQEETADEAKVITLLRENVPDLFLKNRFLDLFSRPMAERDVFASRHGKEMSNEAVVSAYGRDGARFDKFDLILPKGAKIVREKHGIFRIETKRFSIRITSDVSFVGADVPWEFLSKYVKRKFAEVKSFRCTLQLEVSFKAWRLLSARGWQYYRWIDSFQDTLRQSFDFERFLKDISWEAALTTSIIQGEAPHRRDSHQGRSGRRPAPRA